jgi:hypothetical protein
LVVDGEDAETQIHAQVMLLLDRPRLARKRESEDGRQRGDEPIHRPVT